MRHAIVTGTHITWKSEIKRYNLVFTNSAKYFVSLWFESRLDEQLF